MSQAFGYDDPIDLFRVGLPDNPTMRPGPATVMEATAADVKSVSHPLQWVVVDTGLVDRLIPEAEKLARTVTVDPQDPASRPWLAHVDPALMFCGLPDEIWAEQDARDWTQMAFVLPTMIRVRATRAGNIKGSMVTTPYVASSPWWRKWSSPQSFLYTSLETKDRVLCIDYKSPNSLPEDILSTLYHNPQLANKTPEQEGVRAAKFYWPQEDPIDMTTDDKFLAKVWAELVKHKVRHAVTVSYEAAIFFYREVEGDTLYISKRYTLSEYGQLLRAFYAWMAHSLGDIGADFRVPTADEDWKRRLLEFQTSGKATPGIDYSQIGELAQRLAAQA
ncbi:hypothetical protein NEOLEDRAFT_1131094 [Neolentinus lepideus HHB14362 ss-1]|uniref:Uncharacterized protein n=1 Tax=Neolentinus lepideus HHB14362 ss-1 TaxID=1314782 RepID=A0A165TSH2_9AGAM|nr:hypothetical protein NEOLEDRAFT_1131094 [Neolentinus lepideus HHB14362 ss-1]